MVRKSINNIGGITKLLTMQIQNLASHLGHVDTASTTSSIPLESTIPRNTRLHLIYVPSTNIHPIP